MIYLVMSPLCLLAQKEVFIPNEWEDDPYLSEWSWERSHESENFAVFWGPEISGDPETADDPDLRFNPEAVVDTLEKSYDKFIDEIGFVSDASSTNFGTYKTIIVINDTWGDGGPSGWAFGGSYSDTIGAMWVHPGATKNGAVLSHEFAHTLQSMNYIQENTGGGGFINFEPAGFFWEAHANFMRAQLYPYLAREDTPRWLATDMFHYSSTRHHYAAFRLLFHIQHLEGIGLVNRLWRESQSREHPLMTLKRLKGWNQELLNDFMFDYARREVTYDYPPNGIGEILRNEKERLRRDEPRYLWREYTMLEQLDEDLGRYIVPDELAPQDYGINIIPLYPVNEGEEVKIKFKGHTEVNSTAGWRYGFVSVDDRGSIVNYDALHSEEESIITYTMNESEAELYLVVIGAPTEHTSYRWEPGWPKIKRYPYEVSMVNALPEGYQPGYRAYYRDQYSGASHSNGGGFVASSATVDASAYVGPNALVLGNSLVEGNARIEDNARVENATVRGTGVIIKDNANVFDGSVSGRATVEGSAIVNYATISSDAHFKDNALVWGGTFGGSVVVGGDAEIGSCSSGVYLQVPHPNNGRTACDGMGANHSSNQDVNEDIEPFSDEEMSLGQSDGDDSGDDSGSDDSNTDITETVEIHQNAPNPVETSTIIEFSIPEESIVTLEIFNMLGQKVSTLADEESFSAGSHSLEWNPQNINISSGVYIYRLMVNEQVLNKTMTYIRTL
jgi:hypothetical protein